MTELAPPQISSLMEALPGIAAVLRSPVATAMLAVVRAAVGTEPFKLSEAEELLNYGVRRTLLSQEEVDAVLIELQIALDSHQESVRVVASKAEAVAPSGTSKPASVSKASKAGLDSAAKPVPSAAASTKVSRGSKVAAQPAKGKAASGSAGKGKATKSAASSKTPAKPAGSKARAATKPVKSKATAKVKTTVKAKATAKPARSKTAAKPKTGGVKAGTKAGSAGKTSGRKAAAKAVARKSGKGSGRKT